MLYCPNTMTSLVSYQEEEIPDLSFLELMQRKGYIGTQRKSSKLERQDSLSPPEPWFETCCHNCGKIDSYCLSHPDYGIAMAGKADSDSLELGQEHPRVEISS